MSIRSILVPALHDRLGEYAKELEKLAKSEVNTFPNVDGHTGGALEDSITTEKVSNTHYKVGVDAGRLRGDPRNKSGYDYSKVYYYGRGAVRPVRAKVLVYTLRDGTKVRATYSAPTSGDKFLDRAVSKRPRF